jgi:hypothetical protein
VQRDLDRLQIAADEVAADLRRTVTGDWSCVVTADYVLTVRRLPREEQVQLDGQVCEDAWPPQAWSDQYREGTLDDDASEIVVGEITEVLRLWGLTWPVCRQHQRQQSTCSGVWFCDGPPYHEIPVGQLDASSTARAR